MLFVADDVCCNENAAQITTPAKDPLADVDLIQLGPAKQHSNGK